MEQNGILESTNIIDLFFLHYIFCPRINHQMSLFVEAWNHRPPRTERSWTPQQNGWMVWFYKIMLKILQLGIYSRKTSKFPTYMEKTHEVLHLMIEFDLGSVEVPDTTLPVNGSQLEAISHIQPLSESNDYGVSLYLETREIIQALISTEPWQRS